MSVVLAPHPFYSYSYDWTPSSRSYPGAWTFRTWFLAPWKLGELATVAGGFVYVSGEGFLHAGFDHRHYEFRFLRRHGVKIACYFTGNDIRSPVLMKELERQSGLPNLGTYLAEVNRVFASPEYDEVKRKLAEGANLYANVVFNADIDQKSYLEGPCHPFRYFHDDSEVTDDLSKFDDYRRPVVFHAPSSPILKGTPLVRAAVAQLQEEGLDFEYIELSGVPHEQVEAALERCHIVLNEFYSYVPGVFGVEAMAAGCALITSADERLDPQLPPGSNEAWLPTPHHHIAKSLRKLVSDQGMAREYAKSGRDWVRRNAVASVSGKVVTEVLSAALAEESQ